MRNECARMGAVVAVLAGGMARLGVLGALLVGTSAVVAPASAQVKDVPAYQAVVTSENASLRCGPGMYYRVVGLPKGTTVQVDGEDAQWARVIYPAGTPAFVKAEHAQADEAAGTVKLTAADQLMAVNAAGGFTVSWKALLETALPSGTSLKLLEVVRNNDKVIGYKVTAPDKARGFVELKALRRDGSAPATTATATPVKPPTGAAPSTKDGAAPILEPVTPAAAGAAEPVAPAPVRRIGSVEELEAAFQQVRKQPDAEAEYSALIAEFDRAIGQAGEDPARKRQLERRRDFLKILAEACDKKLALERTKKEIDENTTKLNQRLAELERQRVYTIIGLLVPSTVYDGKNLPLMYRLQAVGVTAPPTIGYLAPKPELQLETKLGMVVGVVGESTIDRALSLNVINALRVDVLQAAESKETTPAPPAQPSAAAPSPAPDGAQATAAAAKEEK